MSFLARILGSPPLKLSQSLGAYPLPNGDVSPLHILFGIENTSGEQVEIVSVRVSPKGEDAPLAEGEITGEVPTRVPAKESVRFEVRAKALASASKNAGHAGTPRLSFVVADGEGNEHRRDFAFRVDEYLALKDE